MKHSGIESTESNPSGPALAPVSRKPLLFLAAFFLLFAYSRFARLADRPMHNDEGVNAWFVMNVMNYNDYRYDPTNYHGPLLYYLQLPPTWLNTIRLKGFREFRFSDYTGMTPFTIRMVPAIMGLVLLIGVAAAARRFGPWAMFTSFLLAGVSADLLFFSRYFIHETYLVLFTLGIYLGWARYNDTRDARWFYVAGASASLAIATKETAVIVFGVLALAAVAAEATGYWLSGRKPPNPVQFFKHRAIEMNHALSFDLPKLFLLMFFIWAVLFSSFFMNPNGLVDFFQAFLHWSKEGAESGHVKPAGYFLQRLLIPYEPAALILGGVGAVAAFVKKDRRMLFLAFWSAGIFSAHSLIPYKTPWLVINIVLPLALLAGAGVQTVADGIGGRLPEKNRYALRVAWAVVVGAIIAAPVPRALRLAYSNEVNLAFPQIYVHTSAEVFRLVEEVERVADESGLGKSMRINVVSKEQWPLPFYLRHYHDTSYWGRYQDIGTVDAPVIIAEERQRDGLKGVLADHYTVKRFLLRHGTPLLLYINADILSGSKNLPLLHLKNPVSLPAAAEPGLHRRIYHRADFTEPMDGLNESRAGAAVDLPRDARGPISVEWEGFLHVEKEGRREMIMESNGAASLRIDDATIFEATSGETPRVYRRAVMLTPGHHPIRLRYALPSGNAHFRFSWASPGASPEPVPVAATARQMP